ncbi:Crp/Fnr family transcriptional regulator [Curvibacter sp. CHRR-16]|uniref:Crp/Fnr family transcriptional regulator n=1 Tax=Curvibacter sp. CHRR-16 TaxID=2835872 RepID=UPI001BDA21B8|nr:Crp/Fnr family transcriptional regulator [Curvibacter sp. CHRR-16]MBT0569104.1 Crp/Fnr family transcriptional regulator [Curvibacter sp. CHRR-16]
MPTSSCHDLEQLLQASPLRTVGANAVLVHKGQLPQEALFLEHGTLVAGVLTANPSAPTGPGPALHEMDQQWMTLVGPDWVDLSSVVLGLPACVDVIAQTSVQVRVIARSALLQLLQSQGQVAYAVLHQVARTHRKQTEQALSRLVKDAEARCAEWLLQHARETAQGSAVELQQRKRQIAAQLGIAPETFSRVLRHLRDQHLIAGSGRLVELVDVGGLRLLAGV